MSREQYDFSFLEGIKPSPQKKKEEELIKKYNFSFLDEFEPLKAEIPEEEKKIPISEKIVGLGKKLLPSILGPQRYADFIVAPQLEKSRKEALLKAPEKPEMRALTPKEEDIYERGPEYQERAAEMPRYPETEELEYGPLEKLLDIPGQFLTQFAKMWAWGLPEFVPGEEPPPKSEVAEFTGAIGHLVGLIGPGTAYAPFKVMAGVAKKILKKPAKSVVGKVIQNMTKSSITLGLALGATEWEGEDATEILRNKVDAFSSGAAIGAFFGGMQFVHFSKAHPALSYVFRFGLGSALLDLAEGKHPFDERTLFNKVFDYGLNAYFLKSGVTPKTYQQASKGLLEEIKRFNREAKAEGFDVKLPETLEEITARVGKPETWLKPGEPERLVSPATKLATEEGIVFEPGVPEAEVLKEGYRATEPKPAVNIAPKADGSFDITFPKTEVGTEKDHALKSLWATFKAHPRVLYKDFAKYPSIKEGTVTSPEAAEYFESRGKEVIGKPEPKVIKETKAPTFKDPLHQIIFGEGRVKPNPDYSRKELLKILPARLVASEKDPSAKPMDLMAQSVKREFPSIEGDVDLYDELLTRKTAPVEKAFEKAEREKIEKGYEEFEEKRAAEEKPKEEPVTRWEEAGFVSPEKAPLRTLEQKRAYAKEMIKGKTTGQLKKILPNLEAGERAVVEKEIKAREEKPKELYRIPPAAKKLEKLFREGKLSAKELTGEEKEFLKERGIYEEGKPPPKAKPAIEPEIEEAVERPVLTKISITDPTGKKETFEIPKERIGSIQDYAKKIGVKIEVGKSFRGKWGQLMPPAEEEKVIKDFIKTVKEEPKEKWESWEKEIDEEYQKIYSGLAPPEFVRTVGQKILAKLQIEPQFKAVGGPDTGLAVKRYHPIRNAEVERGEVWIKKLNKLKLSTEDYQELTKIAAKPTKFYPMSKEDRAKFSPAYQIISGKKGFFKEYEARLKELDVIEEGWPKSQLNRLKEETTHIKAVMQRTKKMNPERKAKLENRLKDIYDAVEFIKKSHPQYVHIPRMWFELIWDRNPITAPRIITELFKQRKTLDIEKLANYLTKTKVRDLIPKGEWDLYKAKELDRPLLKPEDLDIRRIMFAYAHKVGHKIALAEIFRTAEKEGLLKDTDIAPQNWIQMPSRLYPTLKGKRAHPVLADYFENNFIRKGFMPPKLGGVLGTIKLMQFYNPLFLPMYDVVQGFWAGSVRSKETPKSIRKAFSSMKNKDSDYWDMHHWGGFSTPYTPSFETYMKRADSIIKENSFIKNLVKLKYVNPYELYKLSWKAAWTGDHFIRMITYHHYLSKGLVPREAAQTAARLHADYASIPPATRKWINKIFFTPSFKISMMAAQAEMVKNAGRSLTKAGREKMTVQDKAMAKALIGLASGVAIREGIMRALGFKTDQFGLKYYKEIETDEGKKELVLHIATPDNVYLRFFHRFKNILPIFGKEEQKLTKLVDRAKWEFHPLWQTSMEIYSNKSVAFEPIYNKFDSPEKIMADVLGYTAKRLARITELIPGISESIRRRDAYNALVKDLDGFGLVLSGFTLPYIRNTREKALVWEINRLKRTFKYMKGDDPAKTAEEAERRLEKFRDHLKKLRERLKELRGKGE